MTTFEPKKGDIISVFEKNSDGSKPLYVITGETEPLYKCIAVDGTILFKRAGEMIRCNDRGDQHTFSQDVKRILTVKANDLRKQEAVLNLLESKN